MACVDINTADLAKLLELYQAQPTLILHNLDNDGIVDKDQLANILRAHFKELGPILTWRFPDSTDNSSGPECIPPSWACGDTCCG